jgi:peptide-methionine (S)-S-oxide reductase
MKNFINGLSLSLIFISFASCAQSTAVSLKAPKGKAIAVFAEGCFWCSEHIFEAVKGVDEAISGYSGGKTKNPSYKEVCSETTGHAESVLVYYDPKIISYQELVKVFFASQNPTTPDQQGPDRGSSYRSIAFYQNDAEKSIIEAEINAVNLSKVYKNKVVTEVLPLGIFYKAEDYHQDYIEHNPDNPYVGNVSLPRFEKFKKTYKGKLK